MVNCVLLSRNFITIIIIPSFAPSTDSCFTCLSTILKKMGLACHCLLAIFINEVLYSQRKLLANTEASSKEIFLFVTTGKLKLALL